MTELYRFLVKYTILFEKPPLAGLDADAVTQIGAPVMAALIKDPGISDVAVHQSTYPDLEMVLFGVMTAPTIMLATEEAGVRMREALEVGDLGPYTITDVVVRRSKRDNAFEE